MRVHTGVRACAHRGPFFRKVCAWPFMPFTELRCGASSYLSGKTGENKTHPVSETISTIKKHSDGK